MHVVTLAHQGGWDEMAMVAVPLLLVAILLVVANRRRRRQEQARQKAAQDPDPDPPVTLDRQLGGPGRLASEASHVTMSAPTAVSLPTKSS